MNITPIQADFSVGEVSRDAQYRSTLDARNRGVKTLTNFVTDARGPVSRRKGFRFLGKVGQPGVIEPCEPAVLTEIDGYSYLTEQPANAFEAITMSPDGLRLYACAPANGGMGQGIAQYSLSSPFDMTTIAYEKFKVVQGGWPFAAFFPRGSVIHPDGDRIYLLDGAVLGEFENAGLAMYTLVTPWDIATLVDPPTVIRDMEASSPDAYGLSISVDGTEIYMGKNAANSATIYQWTMADPWDITSATFTRSLDLRTIPGWIGSNYLCLSLHISKDGKTLLINGQQQGLWVLTLTVPFDLSSAEYTRGLVTVSTSFPYGMYLLDDCSKLFTSETIIDAFYEYDIG